MFLKRIDRETVSQGLLLAQAIRPQTPSCEVNAAAQCHQFRSGPLRGLWCQSKIRNHRSVPMKIQKKTFKKITRRCVALYRLFIQYRKRINMVETELGGELHAC